MTTKGRRYVMLSCVTTMIVLLGFGVSFALIEQPRTITQLEQTVAAVPLGVSAADADKHMGSKPDAILKARGVLMSPMILLAPENDLAAKYGEPQVYSLRIWKRVGDTAVVAIDAAGKVAGHWPIRSREAQ